MTSAPLAPGSVSLRLYPHDLPAVKQVEILRRQAKRAVEIGYDGVMVSEHHADFPNYLPNPVQLAGLLLDVMPVDNILFGSEMVGAVRGVDPETGYYFDDTKRYIDNYSGLSEEATAQVFQGNACKVFSRLSLG